MTRSVSVILLIEAPLQTGKSVASYRHNMLFLTLILGIVLLPKASSLTCYQCIDKSCPTTTECSASDVCLVSRVTSYAGGTQVLEMTSRSCGVKEACIPISMNFGISKTTVNNMCCSTDRCNSPNLPEPPNRTPNGKKCFSCDGTACTNILKCEGSEDHCVSMTVMAGEQKVTLKGCASELVCSDMMTSQMEAILGGKFKCCQGNLCNRASSSSVAILMLVTPLLSLLMFT